MIDKYSVLEKAIEHYGNDNQLMMLMEECSELIQSISKYKRNSCIDTAKNILEEIADVEIMISQLKMILQKKYSFYAGNIIEQEKEKKLARLENRIKEDERNGKKEKNQG